MKQFAEHVKNKYKNIIQTGKYAYLQIFEGQQVQGFNALSSFCSRLTSLYKGPENNGMALELHADNREKRIEEYWGVGGTHSCWGAGQSQGRPLKEGVEGEHHQTLVDQAAPNNNYLQGLFQWVST